MARRVTARKIAISEPSPAVVTAARHAFAVTLCHGPAWNSALGLEQQPGWDAHAAFMDALVAEGFVTVGGPLDDTPYVLLAVRAETAAEVATKLAADPWVAARQLEITRVAPWTLRLGSTRI